MGALIQRVSQPAADGGVKKTVGVSSGRKDSRRLGYTRWKIPCRPLSCTTSPATRSTHGGKRDGWLEQRLTYLAGKQARLKASAPLRRFLRGAVAAYRHFLHTGEPAYRFHRWVTIRTVEPRG